MQIEGNDSGVTGIKVKNRSIDTHQDIALEGVFVYMSGSKPITDFLGDQVAFKEDGGVLVDDFMSTTVEGVWAIGDIRNTPFCLLYTSPSPRDRTRSRMPSSA